MHGLSLIDSWYRRLPRYLFIEDRLRDQVVVELGCGQGLGADLVAERGAAKVLGLDFDERQVLKARARYQRPDLSFQILEDHSLPVTAGSVGVVLVPEAAPFLSDPAWLAEIRRALAPGGICLLAAPNGDLEEPEPDAVAYYDFLQALEGVFPAVSMVAQTPFLAFSFVDFVAPSEELELSLDASLAEDLAEDVAYYVALCSLEPLDPSLYVIAQVPFAPVAKRLQGLLEDGPVDQIELAELQEALTSEREERILLGENAESLRRDLVESQGIAGQLRAGLSTLQAQHATLEDRCNTLSESLERNLRAGEEKASLEESLGEAREALGSARVEIARLQDEQARLHQDREAHRAAADQAQDQMEALRQEVSARHQRISELETSLAANREELEAAGTDRARLDKEIEDARAAAAASQEGKAAVEKALGEQARAREELGSQITALAREGEALRGRMASEATALAEARERCRALEGDLEAKMRRGYELESALAQAVSTVSAQTAKLAELESAEAEWGSGRSELEAELGRMREECESTQGSVAELKGRLGEVEWRRGELEAEIGHGREELESTRARAADLERRLGEVEWRRGELEAELGRAHEELESTRARAADLEKRLGEVEWRRGELEAELGRAHEELESTRARAADLEKRSEEVEWRRGELEAELGRSRDESGVRGVRITELESLLAEARRASIEAVDGMATLEREMDASRADQRSLEVRLQQALTAAASAERQSESHHARSEAIAGQLDQLRNEITLSLTSQESAADAIRAELEAARAERMKAQEEAREAQRRLDQAESDALGREAQLRNDLEDTRQNAERLEEQLEEARRVMEDQGRGVSELEGELGEARQGLEDVGRRVSELEARLGEARQGLAGQTERAAALEAVLDEARRDIEDKGRRTSELEGELGDAHQGLAGQSQRAAALEAALGEARLGLDDQVRRASELERLLSEEGRARTDLAGRCAGMEGELERAHQEIERARVHATELADALERSTQEVVERERRLSSAKTRELSLERELNELGRRAEAALVRAEGLDVALGRARNEIAAASATRREASRQLDAQAPGKAHLEADLVRAEREVDRLRALLDEQAEELAKKQAALEAATQQLSERTQVDDHAAALEAALSAERATRQEVEHNLEGLEASLAELTRLGDMAIGELDAARQEAASHAAEAESWKSRCQELRDLAGRREGAPASPDAAASAELQDLRDRLQQTQVQRQAAEAEKARLQRLARNASGQRDQLATVVEAAREVHDKATAGMALVIGRLEAERERADALEREAATLRGQLRDRTDRIVVLTREAGAEADRARAARRELAEARARLASLDVQGVAPEGHPAVDLEPTPPALASADSSLEVESLAARLEERSAACDKAEAAARTLADELSQSVAQLEELRREQSAGKQRLMALEAEWRVAGWDRAMLEDRLAALEQEQEPLVAAKQALELELDEARDRLERHLRRVEELQEGALRHRREMADREVALAEERAWNEELARGEESLREALARAGADREALARRLSEVETQAKDLSAERARLLGKLEQAERERGTRTTELAPVDAEDHRVEVELQLRDSRIEDLEEVLSALRAERQELKDRCAESNEELVSLRGRLGVLGSGESPPARLQEARERLLVVESLCLEERTHLGELTVDLERAIRQAQGIGDLLAEERQTAKRLSDEKAMLEARAGRVFELELELETMRTQPTTAPRELLAQLQTLHAELGEERSATEQARERVRALNNLIGDREAEVLLLNAQVEKLQRQASQLLVEIRQALREPGPAPEELRALLGRLGGSLEQLL